MATGENKINVIQSNSFNIALANHYHLSIEISAFSLCYCILNNKTLSYEYTKEYNLSSDQDTKTEISEIITNDTILKADFSSKSIAYVNSPSTLVPSALYKEEDKELFLSFNTKISGDVISDNITSQEAYLIYCIPEGIESVITNFFPDAKQKSQESILIEQYVKLNTNTENAYLHLNKNKATVTIFKKNKFIFNNTFEYSTKEDLLYFVLFAFEQVKVSPENIILTIFGDIEKGDDYFNLLYDYIRHIKLGERPSQLSFPNEFNHLSSHKYFGLFTQILCV